MFGLGELDPLLLLLPELPLLPELLLDPPDGGDELALPLGLDGEVEGFDGLDGGDVVGHFSVAGIIEPSGHAAAAEITHTPNSAIARDVILPSLTE